MFLLAIFLGLSTIFTASDLHKAQKEIEHQQKIQTATINQCGEFWLNNNQPIDKTIVLKEDN